MILIQAVLIIAFLILLVKFISNPGSYHARAGSKLFMVLLVMLAILVIMFPNSSNTVAHWFGVRYGVNLLVYTLSLAFTFLVLHLYLHGRQAQAQLAQVVRRLAILEAELYYRPTKPSKKIVP